jgi:DNA-binding CsgD family transcriptional regulator
MTMRQTMIGFGLLSLCLLILFRLASYQYLLGQLELEWGLGLAAILFFFIGWYFNRNAAVAASNPETPTAHTTVQNSSTAVDEKQIKKYRLTGRELEVLEQMARGLSNLEIAASLHLSESTIKSHVSNILAKLEAKRRTHAIQLAKSLRIISSQP